MADRKFKLHNITIGHGTPTKKQKTSNNTILTFGLSHSPVQVQLQPSHTIHDLVDIICRETSVGQNGEAVDDHMWNVTVPGKEGMYESGDHVQWFEGMEPKFRANQTNLGELGLTPNTTMGLEYDYGSTVKYKITLLEETESSDGPITPRRKPVEVPAGYTKFSPEENVDLNALFQTLNKWAFTEPCHPTINLFQAGRKANHGLLEKENNVLAHMILMPAAPSPKDLSDYLHCLDYACRFKYRTTHDGIPTYSWYSMIVVPSTSITDKLKSNWAWHDQDPGFCEKQIAPPKDSQKIPSLNKVFPKVAALAGYVKDPKVKKGWITYKDRNVLVCSGEAENPKSNAPKGTAFLGMGQHEPKSNDDVLFQVEATIESIHDLFCVVEGLLRTL